MKVKELNETFEEYVRKSKLDEGGLARVYQQQKDSHIGMITAFRGLSDEEPSKEELQQNLKNNRERNKQLASDLQSLGLGFRKVKGYYPEVHDGKTVHVNEEVFLVSTKEDQDLKYLEKSLIKLGKKYDQDSVFVKPKDSEQAYLIGTNPTGFPGLGNKETLGTFKPNKLGDFYTEMKGGRTFVFDSVEYVPNSFTRQALERKGVDSKNIRWMPVK